MTVEFGSMSGMTEGLAGLPRCLILCPVTMLFFL
jgi:hypothetical protein